MAQSLLDVNKIEIAKGDYVTCVNDMLGLGDTTAIVSSINAKCFHIEMKVPNRAGFVECCISKELSEIFHVQGENDVKIDLTKYL